MCSAGTYGSSLSACTVRRRAIQSTWSPCPAAQLTCTFSLNFGVLHKCMPSCPTCNTTGRLPAGYENLIRRSFTELGSYALWSRPGCSKFSDLVELQMKQSRCLDCYVGARHHACYLRHRLEPAPCQGCCKSSVVRPPCWPRTAPAQCSFARTPSDKAVGSAIFKECTLHVLQSRWLAAAKCWLRWLAAVAG